MFVSILLFFISFISLFLFVTLLFLNRHDAVLFLSMSLSMMSILFGSIVFYKITNTYPLNDISEYHTNKFKKLLIKTEEFYVIRFFKKDGLWVCENNSETIKLNLGKYLFQKSYLISYVVRNIRYPLISDKLPLKCLFMNKYFIKDKFNIKLELIDGNKKFERIIVKNGVSKYGFIAKQITFSPFYLSALSNRHLQSIHKFKSYIDEKRYKHFYVKDKKNN